MKQTSESEWVYIVLHSEALHYQILNEDEPRARRPRWVRVLLKLIKVGSKFYGL